jgi:hypothetical protein
MKLNSKNKMISLLALTLVLLFTGCKKFLEERSQTLQYANNSAKLREVLLGEGYMQHFPGVPSNFASNKNQLYFPWLNAMDDDIADFVIGPSPFEDRRDVFGFYTWQKDPYVTMNTYVLTTDNNWPMVYKAINALNGIIAKSRELTDNPAELDRIRGEALFLRAHYYFYMVNSYAGAYKPETAATDLGVPVKITEYVEDGFFKRNTIAEVYNQILLDLTESEGLLKNTAPSILYYTNVVAVNLLQSRVYLYMQNWEEAVKAANKVIERKGTLYNLAEYKPAMSFFSLTNPEAIFTQGGNAMVLLMPESISFPRTFRASDDLINQYQLNDLRRTSFFALDSYGKYRYAKMYMSSTIKPSEVFSDNYYMRNAEAYLNKAEAEAMLDQSNEASQALNTLRKARFLPADYVDISLNGQSLINFVRAERRRELCFEGHRWFDLKRYAVNAKYPFSKEIVHEWHDATVANQAFVKATIALAPNDPAYLVPIPAAAITWNQGALIQNPERPERKF